MSELFYVFGIALTVMAVIVSFVGMRMESFPSRPMMVAGLGLMMFLVVGSAAFAVVLSREEKEHRSEEIAEYRAEQAEEQEQGEGSTEEEPTDVRSTETDALALTSPDEGDLIFVLPDEEEANPPLEAPAGEVTIDYTNPSDVPHNVAIEDGSETVAQGETVTGGASGAASAELDPGEYVYYCSIPSHREAGMEGDLTVE